MLPAPAVSSVVEELETKLAAQRAELHDLATMGAVITSIRELDAILSVVMDMSLRLVDGEVGMVFLAHPDGLKKEIAWGVDEHVVQSLNAPDGTTLPSYCFRKREAVIQNNLQIVSDNGLRVNSVISVPIQTKSKCFGVLLMINRSTGENFSPQERDHLNLLLNFVAVSIENCELMKEELKRHQMEQEMQIARQVQSTILPQNIADIPGVEIGVSYHPAHEVGGDFYEIVATSSDQFVVIIGDVSNKGVPAALVMSACSGVIKAILEEEPQIEVGNLACKINDLMSSQIIKDREMFVTLFFCRIDLQSGSLTYCNAGHLPGLLWSEQARQIDDLATGGPIIGQFPGVNFTQATHEFVAGDRLLLFTDGLTEAVNTFSMLFGRERVAEVYRTGLSLSPDQFCLRMKQRVDQFTAGAPSELQDDFTVLQIRKLQS